MKKETRNEQRFHATINRKTELTDKWKNDCITMKMDYEAARRSLKSHTKWKQIAEKLTSGLETYQGNNIFN